MFARRLLCTAVIIAVMPVQAFAQTRPKVPIVIQGGTREACADIGLVIGLRPKGARSLAVKAGPGASYPQIDKLNEGKQVYLCGERNDWYAVVYAQTRTDCNVSTPWPRTRSYTGPCHAGWVHKRYVKSYAASRR